MEEYLHNFEEIEKGRGPSPLKPMECGFSRCTTVPPHYRSADSSLSSPCAATALSWCSSSWLSSHRRRWRFGAGSRIHNWMSSLGPRGRGGGHRSTYIPFLCHGLRPKLVHNGNEIQQSGQANNRRRDCCLDRGIIDGFFRPPRAMGP